MVTVSTENCENVQNGPESGREPSVATYMGRENKVFYSTYRPLYWSKTALRFFFCYGTEVSVHRSGKGI